MLPPDDNANIARHLPAMAARHPAMAALKIPRGRRDGRIEYLTLSFAELDAEVNAWGDRLRERGVRPGDRTIVMVRQGLPLIAAVFALFEVGAVPVIIDPGMGLKSFLACVRRSHPRVLLGIPVARLISRAFPRAFSSVEVRVPASGSLTARLTRAGAAPDAGSDPRANCGRGANPNPSVCRRASNELAAILFTSGSTGAPKGVCYEHGVFEAQVRLIRSTYGIEPGEIDLPMLAVFALFNPALGLTTVIPEIDPRHPARVDPAKIVLAIRQEGVTNSFGSPTLWRKIAGYCIDRKIPLPTLRRVLCAGAPVPAGLWSGVEAWMPNGRLHSPYGATEALPVSTISSDEIDQTAGIGACVGRPVAGTNVKIVAVTDGPINSLAEVRELPVGEIGEIIVAGPVVTRRYDEAPAETAAAKIGAPPGRSAGGGTEPARGLPGGAEPAPAGSVAAADPVWHRMGDCGYRDPEGRLWFCGRKVERVETAAGTLHTEPCEQVFRRHPRVGRCALVGIGPRGRQTPAIVVEARPANATAAWALARELRELARGSRATAAITRFHFHPQFPVDVRHNAKIHRLTLARWAATAPVFEAAPDHREPGAGLAPR